MVTIATTAVPPAITGRDQLFTAWAGTGLASAVGATGTGATLMAAWEAAFVGLCSQAAVECGPEPENLLKAAESLLSQGDLQSVLMAAGSAEANTRHWKCSHPYCPNLAGEKNRNTSSTGVVVDQVAKVLATRVGQGQFDYLTHKLRMHGSGGQEQGLFLGKARSVGWRFWSLNLRSCC